MATPFHQRISFRITYIIIFVLTVGLGLTVGYFWYQQNETLITSKEREIIQEADILYTAIKNNMLAGEAPIATNLFRDFKRGNFASEIDLYRATGKPAFSDNSTIDMVNRILMQDAFKRRENVSTVEDKSTDPNLGKTVRSASDLFLAQTEHPPRKIVIYKPLVNQPKCSQCHGIDHVVRGVIRIASPVDDIFLSIRDNTILAVVLYTITVILLSLIIVQFINRTIIKKILHIGQVVEDVGRGNFNQKINPSNKDEIASLSLQINTMIQGLRERFNLSKFVSKSTLEHIQNQENIELGGEKKNLTVLFSDIRGFTDYSDRHNPEDVILTLNKIMNLQSDIVHKWNGDIDKFVGDELMAVFDGEDMVDRAVRTAIEITTAIDLFNQESGEELYLGIGINTGELVSGNIGSRDRIDHTVIGDTVNVGSRLCSLAKKNEILISEQSYRAIANNFNAEPREGIEIKGKREKLNIYLIQGEKP